MVELTDRRADQRTIVVHPDSSYRYYGFYLRGLEELYGGLRVRFSQRHMPPVTSPKNGLALVTSDDRRIFVAADDLSGINEKALDWCDSYGQVNVTRSDLHRDRRLLAIGPSFGIPWHGQIFMASYLLRAGLRSSSPQSVLSRLRDYRRHQLDRSRLESYVVGRSDPNFLFFRARNWTNHARTNQARSSFLEIVQRAPDLELDVGFVDDWHSSASAAMPHAEYLRRLQISVVAFNTPAVHDCLGWKLAEYLALGKAIISLPLTREMPERLVHGVHAHFVDGSPDAVLAALHLIRSDDEYRNALERQARSYWDRWLAPTAVTRRLLAAVGSTHVQSIEPMNGEVRGDARRAGP